MEVKDKLFLAPLAGYSDIVFRKLCRGFGAEITVSEMISVKGAAFRQKKTLALAATDDQDRPFGIQLFGHEPSDFSHAASVLEEKVRPDFFDINCGCPVRKVLRQKCGAWLLTEPERIGRIVAALKSVVHVPVSVKIRLGYDSEKNHRLVGRIAEENGADFLIVHGRTRPELFAGPVDLDAIAELKAHLAIPVIGNGGVRDAESYQRMMGTGCDAVMVGTVAIGRPWVFAELSASREGRPFTAPTREEQIDIFVSHMKESSRRFREDIGLRLNRCYAMQYIKDILKDMPGKKNFLVDYTQVRSLDDLSRFAGRMKEFVRKG